MGVCCGGVESFDLEKLTEEQIKQCTVKGTQTEEFGSKCAYHEEFNMEDGLDRINYYAPDYVHALQFVSGDKESPNYSCGSSELNLTSLCDVPNPLWRVRIGFAKDKSNA